MVIFCLSARVLSLHPDKKHAGVLAPLFAVRGTNDLGIGDTEAIKEVAAWCARNGLTVLQILPINETGGDHSPYNILSSIAIDAITIATIPGILPDLSKDAYAKIATEERLVPLLAGPVQYGEVSKLKWELLTAAYANFRSKELRKKTKRASAFMEFLAENEEWIADYILFRALLATHLGDEVVDQWPKEHRSPAAAREWLKELPAAERRKFREREHFYGYVQWIAHTQWAGVKETCEKLGVALMGDIPVGVSLYSADVFAEPEIFDLSRSCGAPPEHVFAADPFTSKWGQNWGFPLYKWESMERDNYRWWRRRLRCMRGIFHFLRVDHALGFFRIYSFPWRPERNGEFLPLSKEEAMRLTDGRLPCFMLRDDSTLENQLLNREQGERLFKMIIEETGEHRVVAEDLGEVAPYVRPSLLKLEVPGFKIPQWERNQYGQLTPGADYPRLSLATYATHDHEPIHRLWDDWCAFSSSPDGGRADWARRSMRELLEFCGRTDIQTPQPYSEPIRAALLEGLYKTNAWLAVNMITDLLGLSDRFNVPGAVGSANWTHRITPPISEWDTVWAEQLATNRAALERTGRVSGAACP